MVSLQPLRNQLTKNITKNTTTAIDHVVTNSPLHKTINTGINIFDILDHFPIFLITKAKRRMTEGKVQITKHLIDTKTKENF